MLHIIATPLVLAAALIVSQSHCRLALASEQLASTNIVIILADDLGYGHLGCYGQKDIKTPHLDRMAAEGMRFTNYYSGSTVCAPSRCVLMTGYHTGHCYIRGNSQVSLRVGDITVAEVLKKAGYRCGAFGKWGLGQENTGGMPTVQGFDSFYGYLDQHHAHNFYPAFLIRDTKRVPLTNVVPGEGDYGSGVASEKNEYSHDLIFAEALQFLDTVGDRPFFLYLPVTIPHVNNEAGTAGMEIPDYGEYADRDWPENEKGEAAMISRLDSDVGTLLEKLREMGVEDHTLVMFTSDNGPHPAGGRDVEFFDSNGPLRGIKTQLYEGGIRMPLIVRWPGHVAAGTVSDHIGYHGDLMATAAELAGGARYPTGTDSLSLLPVFLGKDDAVREHEHLYWEYSQGGFTQAVRMGKWKALRTGEDNATLELYDLEADLGEEHNLREEQPEVAVSLTGIMQQAHTPSEEWPVNPTPTRRPARREPVADPKPSPAKP